MTTLRQMVMRYPRKRRLRRNLVRYLEKCPFKLGVVRKVFEQKPKKPNSAKRNVIKVQLKTGKIITCHVPGISHSLSKFSSVWVRGGRTQDLIGVRYKAVRCKGNLKGVFGRISRKTKFGYKPSVDDLTELKSKIEKIEKDIDLKKKAYNKELINKNKKLKLKKLRIKSVKKFVLKRHLFFYFKWKRILNSKIKKIY